MSGYLDEIKFKEGALVKKGDVLFVIDPRPFVAELNAPRHSWSKPRRCIPSPSRSSPKRRPSRAERRRVLTINSDVLRDRRNYFREASLPRKNSTCKNRNCCRTRRTCCAPRRQIASSQAAIGTAKAAVQSAQAAVELAELNLEYTNVTAPIDGRISRELVTEGNLVQSGDQGGTVLTTIVSVDPIYAYFDVDERTVLRVRQLIREGKAESARDVEVPVQAGPGQRRGISAPGNDQLRRQSDQPEDRHAPRARRVSERGRALSPGMFVRVRIPIGQSPIALLVTERRHRQRPGPEDPLRREREERSGLAADVRWGRFTTACGRSVRA